MLEKQAREKIQPYLNKLGSWLHERNVSADTVTIAALIAGILSGICIKDDSS